MVIKLRPLQPGCPGEAQCCDSGTKRYSLDQGFQLTPTGIMIRHMLAAAALTVATSFGQTPIPPQKPVMVVTEIGEVAGSRNKIQVLVSSQVEPKKITGAIQINDKGMMGGRFEIDSAVAPELA